MKKVYFVDGTGPAVSAEFNGTKSSRRPHQGKIKAKKLKSALSMSNSQGDIWAWFGKFGSSDRKKNKLPISLPEGGSKGKNLRVATRGLEATVKGSDHAKGGYQSTKKRHGSKESERLAESARAGGTSLVQEIVGTVRAKSKKHGILLGRADSL